MSAQPHTSLPVQSAHTLLFFPLGSEPELVS
ncbi:hypothetical protein DFR29_10230 [Tahibacter aquaticus]|uniref:Uncharacterized protein n=1 Tax=Tahibacter aquaticus TaxID=520092 RepID=A0A4R6Z6J1_9GAMM|nr:hypothetical protein DFR29_10230 [Tahibacter aquaticus]